MKSYSFSLTDGALVSVILSRDVATGHLTGLTLHDRGGGIPQSESGGGHHRFLDAFYSTSPSRSREPSYHYSRMFGVPYSGAGMGLLKSKVGLIENFLCLIYFLYIIFGFST